MAGPSAQVMDAPSSTSCTLSLSPALTITWPSVSVPVRIYVPASEMVTSSEESVMF